jgi:NAD(P)-dependent dehydrogenase (short-subunit alcohol dehydrogenase family)
MGRLQGKVAIVTGAGGGLGRSAAECFAREGARVVLVGRTARTIEESARLITDQGGEALALSGNVSAEAEVDAVVRGTLEHFKRVDILVNNAALLMSARENAVGSMGTTLEINDEDWGQVLDVNLRGVFLMCRRVLPHMKEQASGAILNVASTAAVQGYPNSHHYSASKGGISALTKSLAVTYGAYGIRVNTLIAGGFESPGTADLMPLFAPLFANPRTRYLWCPLGRMATSDEIAPTMAFLCSDEASYIHGADIAVDGGQSINAVPNFGPRPLNAPLDAQALLAAGTAETGLEDYGDRQFVPGLEVFTEALRSEARLNRFGHLMLAGDLVRMLTNRLRLERDLARHPEILDEQIVAPIVVVGLPRTGTSKLQRMLAQAPDAQRLDVWRLLNPAPFPGEQPGNPQGRIDFGLVVEQTLREMFPDYMARHPTEALQPDEELLLMEMSFECGVSSLRTRTPSHRAFVEKCDPRTTYALMRSLLQYLQWQDGGHQGRHWVMKSPVHLGQLDVLLEFFPDAVVVQCHRDPRDVIPSFASLIEAARRMTSDEVDPLEIGADMFDHWAAQLDANLRIRAALDPGRVLDVQYDRIARDGLGVAHEIYAHAGRTLSPEAEAAFAAYEAMRPPGHFGRHEYTTERYGLDLDRIDERFADYRALFLREAAAV